MVRDAPLKFTRELSGTLTIQGVTELSITVSGTPYTQAIALTPDEVFTDWDPVPVAELTDSAIENLLRQLPEIVLLGTGGTNVFPPRELMFAFARRGVGLEVMDTAAAARTFNVLSTEGRRVAALLYL
jgi:uncharacterized protein